MSETQTYSVPGISCGHCKTAIETQVAELAGVRSVTVDVDAREVTVTGDLDPDAIRSAVEEAGYEVAAAS